LAVTFGTSTTFISTERLVLVRVERVERLAVDATVAVGERDELRAVAPVGGGGRQHPRDRGVTSRRFVDAQYPAPRVTRLGSPSVRRLAVLGEGSDPSSKADGRSDP